MEIALVAPEIWEPLLDEQFQSSGGHLALRGRRLLFAFHDRHVGITPALVKELLPALINPSLPASGPWSEVFQRFGRELAGQHASKRPLSQADTGFLLRARPDYVLLRVALPLVDVACARIGKNYLFCADEVDATVTKEAYETYTQALYETLLALVREDTTDMLDLFWRERPLTLSTLTHPRALPHPPPSPLPEPMPTASAFLWRLAPDPAVPFHRRLFQRLTRLRKVPDLLRRESAIEGVRISRHEPDIKDALFSEYLHPSLLRAERFFSSGFLAWEREPKQAKLRDVLFVGVLAPSLHNTATGDFLRACWFDLAARLGLILQQMNLLRTEFRWIESDDARRVRVLARPLHLMPTLPESLQDVPHAWYKAWFHRSLHWTPALVDDRREAASLPAAPHSLDTRASGLVDEELRWIAAAWRQQPALQENGALHSSGQRLPANEFAFTHILTFLPSSWIFPRPDEGPNASLPEPRQIFSLLAGHLRAANAFQGRVSITWAPESLRTVTRHRRGATPAWRYDAAFGWRQNALDGLGDHPQLREMADRLLELWMNQILREVARG